MKYECLFCLEHTGLYSLEMMKQLSEQQLSYVVISGLELRKSLGIRRGKDDRVDARRIAEYAYLRQEKLVLHQMPDPSITQLKDLLSLRAMHVRTRAGYKARLKEQKRVMKQSESPVLFQSQKSIIHCLDRQIEKLEKQIRQLIQQDDHFRHYFALITSVKGIGLIVAAKIIVKTKCFTAFANWRKFACHIGTAPFPNESGLRKGKHRISNIADKEMKTLLSLAAQVAIVHDPQIKQFYHRKVKEGKPKKNVINAIRNKMIARVFSVAKRGTPYVILHPNAA